MKRFRHILYVAEPGVDQTPALARALSLAENNQADLSVIAVLPGLAGSANDQRLERQRQAQTRSVLQALLDGLQAPETVPLEVLSGRRFLCVIRRVLERGHDLVIKPAENPDWLERLFGSDDMQLLRKCPCPVWITRPDEPPNYANVVTALDLDVRGGARPPDDALNHDLLDLAASLALSDFAQLHLLHVWDVPEIGLVRAWSDQPDAAELQLVEAERQRRRFAMQRLDHWLRERLGAESYRYLAPRVLLPRGEPQRLIPAQARALEADLVVMGTLGRAGIPGLFIGNTAEAVLDQLRCAVLAIKPAGFVSPVSLS